MIMVNSFNKIDSQIVRTKLLIRNCLIYFKFLNIIYMTRKRFT